jgi:hypothetical protein
MRQERFSPDRWKQDPEAKQGLSVFRDRRGQGTTCMAVFLAVACLLLLAAAGCSKAKTESDTIYSGHGIRIKLVQEVEKSGEPVAKGFDHPWEVDKETLDNLLGSILYQQTVMFFNMKKRKAFPSPQRLMMLKGLQEAFAKATPNQAIDFSFYSKKKWLIISRENLTDGILFRKDGKLNCAFRNLAFEDLADPEGSGEPFRGDPTKQPVRSSWKLDVSPGQELVKKDASGLFGAQKFPNWIQLEIARAWPSPVEEEEKPGKEEKAVQPEEQAEPDPGADSRAEIEKRLNFLEELHTEGAISEMTYQQKKKTLLEELDKVPPPKPGE